MSDITVSVCVLTYNHELYLKESLDSILIQKANFPFEIIIADDFSTDRSRDIIQEFKKRHPDKVKIIFQKSNVGVMRNFIDLLDAANSKYIAICESDDYWIDPDKLQKQVDILENHPEYSMVCSNRLILEMDRSKNEDKAYTKEIYTTRDIIEGFIPGTQTLMFRNYKTLTAYLIKFKEIYSGDRYLSYFCSLMGDIYRMKDITAVYRITGTGVWSKNSSVEKLQHISNQMIEFHTALGLPINNEILAAKSFDSSIKLFTYFIKRPGMFFQKGNCRYIFAPFRTFSKMNRFRFIFNAIINKIKKR